MAASDVKDDPGRQRATARSPLGAVGVMGVVAGLSVPLTLVVGLVVAIPLALVLAFQRRWPAMAWVLGAAVMGFGAWMLFGMLDPSSDVEFEISPADPDLVR